jgi:hypothetical protein
MSTQIYINPNQCKPEYTKIVAHSFAMGLIGDGDLFYGGNQGLGTQAIWSKDIYDYANSRFAPSVNKPDKTVGIPLPINLVADDIVTLSGTAYFNNIGDYTNLGWEVYFSLGVYYFDCTYNQGPETPAFTFIPVATYPIAVETKGSICFEEMVTLNSNFDIHETRFLVGFSVYILCPEGEICTSPTPAEPDLATVSYTFDIERPCAVITSESNFIIRNCCEPVITELVNIPELQVGSFHVDDEGNCWEVISSSNDVTNFTRNFVDTYTSCVECQTANPCPQNLAIASCCVQGFEFVTGSLPGLNVGDTFVDNNGLCWTVQFETGAPISEESITVDTIIPGECGDCTTANPCPNFWAVTSCCGQLKEVIATSVSLNLGDSFVDTNGICWSVVELSDGLPSNYDIVVDTVYPGPGAIACDQCKIANPCPTEYFITIRNCCDNDRVEVAQVPAEYMFFSEGTIFSDAWGICWEVMSYDTTGVETYPIWDWTSIGAPNKYRDCQKCLEANGKGKIRCNIYEVVSCIDSNTYTVVSTAPIVIGQFYSAVTLFIDLQCFEVIGYGTLSFLAAAPTVNPILNVGSCAGCPSS